MKRRNFVASVGAMSLATAIPVAAQRTRPMQLAWVTIERANVPSPGLDAFVGGMRELGYAKDKDFTVAVWYGEGSGEKLSLMAADIVRSQPDLIVTQGGVALMPLVRAGVKTPIVFTYSGDPVDAGLVESFARPGGNMTGISASRSSPIRSIRASSANTIRRERPRRGSA
jgi:putative ABC transport system substrate-binding protein